MCSIYVWKSCLSICEHIVLLWFLKYHVLSILFQVINFAFKVINMMITEIKFTPFPQVEFIYMRETGWHVFLQSIKYSDVLVARMVIFQGQIIWDNAMVRQYGVFSCPEQLNRWPCHWLTHWLSQSLLLLPYKEQS